MRYYMFATNEAIMENIHETPRGCIMDFCQEKSQIILKMRTADVCHTCMQKIIERDIPQLHTRQFFDVLDGIRLSMTFRSRSAVLNQPSRMEIRGHTKKIFLTDLGGLELRLNPKEKALYLLFLNHPDGLYLTDLQDHKGALKKLYGNFCKQSDPHLLNKTIEVLINPLENDVNVILSRINRKIKEAVGEPLLHYYSIKGERGEKKYIKLDRELLIHNGV
jgi:hypothetical protein